jgi:hypothetical protein
LEFESVEQAQKLWKYLPPEGQKEAHDYVTRMKAGSGEVYDPATGTWSKPSTSTAQKLNTATSTSKKQYYIPGQQSLEDAISKLNYTPKSESDLRRQAQTWADVQINPQQTALQSALRNAIESLNSQENIVNANYANLASNKDAAVKEASERALESAIARGGGRSGIVDWTTVQQTKPIMSAYAQAEAQKVAELNNIANRRTLVQTEYDNAVKALEEQRGRLAAAQLAALLRGDEETAMQYAQTRANAEYQLASLLNNRDMYNIDAVRADTALTGVAGGLSGTVPLRDYLTSNGLSDTDIKWDSATGNVTIKGKTYTPTQLTSVGGYIQNGRWQIPESVIRSFL